MLSLIASLMCGVMESPCGRHCPMEQSLTRYVCVCCVCVCVCVCLCVCVFVHVRTCSLCMCAVCCTQLNCSLILSLQNMQGQEILKMLEGGHRMNASKDCPPEIYDVMLRIMLELQVMERMNINCISSYHTISLLLFVTPGQMIDHHSKMYLRL